jgi:nuclear pore complex protein Nup98-Nup96
VGFIFDAVVDFLHIVFGYTSPYSHFANIFLLGGFGSTTGGGFGASKPTFGATTSSGGGLFGSGTATAGGSGFGSGGFGTTAASTSTPFGGGGTTSLFGATSKPATSFGSTTTTAGGTSLFGGGGTTGGFGSGGTGAFGATTNPGLGTNIGDPPGTGAVPFQPFQEKETTSNLTNSFQNILFMDNYRKWSAEELRLADYNQNRKHGTTGGSGAFGSMTSGFGSFGGQTQPSGFGAGSSGTGGLFGSQQPATTGFGQSTTGTGAFGSSSGGGLFGKTQPTTGGLFGAATQPTQTGSAFGSTGGAFGQAATAGGFGSTTAGTGTGLFGGGSTAQAAKPTGFSFGQTTGQTTGAFGSAGGTGAFGSAAPASGTGGGLFGSTTAQQSGGTGLFGQPAQPTTTGAFGSGGFGSQTQQPGGGLFGQQKPAGLFGQSTTGLTGTGAFGTGGTTTQFGQPVTQQAGTGLFGQKPQQTTQGTGLFGQPAQTGTTGGGLFGQPAQTQQPQQGGGLFGGGGTKSLFGGSTQSTGGGLFGTQQPAQGTGIFGTSGTQQQPQASGLGGSLFGTSQGVQTTPQSLTTSINDVSAYGTPSLFQGLGQSDVQNPGPLATPLSGAKKGPAKKAILPLFKMTPGSANKFVTPQKKGYGFSYSTFGTPTSPSSVASTPGALGQSLLGGSISRGLSKSISSSNLRRTFNPEDSILAPGAFSSSSGPRFYGSTGSHKKLIINRDIRTDLFTSPSKDKPPANDARKLSKRVSFDTSVPPAIENSAQDDSRTSPVTPTTAAEDLGFLRPPNRSANGINGSKATPAESSPEMEQVKGNELAIVHEEGSPVPLSKATQRPTPKQIGDYWTSPSQEEVSSMSRAQRSQVMDYTVGRVGIGQIRFKVPVDLSNMNLDEIPGGIVVLETRSATVYPISAKKPSVGKGLNVPSEISLEHSWPRGRAQEKSGPRVNKHIERLRKIENTEFIGYDPQTGVWTFSVEHFTTYTCEFDDEDTDAEMNPDVREIEEQASFASPGGSPEFGALHGDEDDTFDFRRKRRALPGAFDVASDDEDTLTPRQSFLAKRSADDDAHAMVSPEEEGMDIEDMSEGEDLAVSLLEHHLPAEQQQDSPQLGSIMQAQETPAGIMRARMRAIKESATPIKMQVAGGDDWMDMLQQTVSPQKRDRVSLKSLTQADIEESRQQRNTEKASEPWRRRAPDNRGFATSIDLMNSLFERAKIPTQAPRNITTAKGFVKVGF